MKKIIILSLFTIHCSLFTIQAQVPELWGLTNQTNGNITGNLFKIFGDGSGYTNLHQCDTLTGINSRGRFSTFNNNGKLYGTMFEGGPESFSVYNGGVLFSYDTLTNIYTDLYNFYNDSIIGGWPNTILCLASNGKFYGSTNEDSVGPNIGRIFCLDPSDNSLIIDSISEEISNFMQASNGLLYAVRIRESNSSPIILSLNILTGIIDTVYVFPNDTHIGSLDFTPNTLLQATDGKLYGNVRLTGDSATEHGYIYSFDPVTNIFTDIINFQNNDTLGYYPQGSLIQATNGLLYGMTPVGGNYGHGVIFSIDPVTSIYHKLYDFDTLTGRNPNASLMQASDGKLYGTAWGGLNSLGVIFSYDITTNIYTDIHDFANDSNGNQPVGDLIEMIPCVMPAIITSGNTGLCLGDSILLTANGANRYFWQEAQSFDSIVSVSPTVTTTYHIIGSNNGCFAQDSIVVTVNQSPATPIITGGDTICAGDSLTLSTGSYSHYLWSNGTTTQTNIVTNAGTYIVTVSITDGCTGTDSINVIVKTAPVPLITANSPTIFCQGGSVILTTSSFPQYLWSNAASTQSITVNTSGTYIVSVTASNGCTGTALQLVTVNPSPSPTLLGDSTFCPDSSLILNVGTFAQYNWSTGASTSTITVNTANTYTVTVTDANGCTGTTAISVTKTPSVAVTSSFISDTLSGCNPLTVTFTNTGSNGTSYLWNFGDSSTLTTLNATHTYTDSGTFTITLITINSGPCGIVKDTFIQANKIIVDEPIKVTSSFTAEPLTGCAPLVVTFTNSSINGENYYWYFGDGNFDSTKNPIHIYDTGTYHIYLIAYNNTNRCTNPPDSTGLTITVENCELSIPNIFSPNGDGKNDFFNLIADGYSNFHLIIFDRWGLKVFESSNATNQWNGKVNNTGGECVDGTYYYIFTANDLGGSPFTDKGYISLIR